MFSALKSLVLGFCVALSLGAGALAQAPKAPIVAAAADLEFALDDIAAKFKVDTGQEVKLTYGSSGNFTRQILEGAPFGEERKEVLVLGGALRSRGGAGGGTGSEQ